MTNQLCSDLELLHTGKVRETYKIPGYPDLLAQIATDRVSTHNEVHLSTVPDKGVILTQLTWFWLTGPLRGFKHHLVAAGYDIYRYLPIGFAEKFPNLHHRTLIVRKLDMIPIEAVWRQHMAGSLLKAYQKGEDPYGLELPEGLVEMSPFPSSVVFTPTEKSETDPPLDHMRVREDHSTMTDLSCRAFFIVAHHLAPKGITVVDSKTEWGRVGKTVMLGDEAFTPDSSRFVWSKDIQLGQTPPWLDKQLLRDEAEKVCGRGNVVPINFKTETICQTAETYKQMFQIITETSLKEWLAEKCDVHRP